MSADKLCACKGANYCLECRSDHRPFVERATIAASYSYCPLCRQAWPGWLDGECGSAVWQQRCCQEHRGQGMTVPGLTVALDAMSLEEERRLIDDMDSLPWQPSQSGRRKQNFGPRCNFKRRKLSAAGFAGFPWFGEWLQRQLVPRVPALAHYVTIEQCSLEYRPETGACISPHVDDCWVWGERVVSVNALADTWLTLVPYTGDAARYNLQCAGAAYSGRFATGATDAASVAVRVPMPRRSVTVLSGEARYDWLHCVLRGDIGARRLCVALREFAPAFRPGGEQQQLGDLVRQQAARFWPPDHSQHLTAPS